MGRQLVLKVTSEEMAFSEMRTFVKAATDMKVRGSALVTVYVTDEAGKLVANVSRVPNKTVRFIVNIPDTAESVLPTRRRIVRRIKKKTPHEKAVAKQIAEHKEKKASGEKIAYVPPVGHKGPPKPIKVKCPVCNVRKQVVTVSRLKSIKPHVSHGEPCSGGGTQVVKVGKTWTAITNGEVNGT